MVALIVILFLIATVIKFSGALNVDQWQPERKAQYENLLKTTIPDTLTWVRFKQWHGMRDVVIRGEFYCSESDWDLMFVESKSKNEFKDISSQEAINEAKAIAFGDPPVFRSDCRYQFQTTRCPESTAFESLIAEIPDGNNSPQEEPNNKIHVWFVKTL